ncbi:MAG TPA: DUF2381 family protein [Myxococcaceae bacterium]|nr:DUF2381 family protein [Myxococcaceae bacterium]
MRAFTIVQGLFLIFGILRGSPAWAQERAPRPARTLTVPGPSGATVHSEPIAVATNFTTTLELEIPVSEVSLNGPGSERVGVQRMGRQIIFLRPGGALSAKEQPMLTVTAEDGIRYVFPLVGDAVAPDTEVRVRRGRCPTEEELDLAAVELLLREPVDQLRKSAFQERNRRADADGVTMQVWGALPFSRIAIVGLRITSEAQAPFLFERARFHSPTGRLKVLGALPQADGAIAIVVERPADEADGVLYTLSVSEKDGPRQLVADVIPWPLASALSARGVPGDELGPEEGAEANPERGRGDGKLPRPKVRERR